MAFETLKNSGLEGKDGGLLPFGFSESTKLSGHL